MTKTLKELFEVYKPKSPDEQRFVDKHVTIKHKDRNGNGDDVFKGNTKYAKRKEERHGYDVGEDEKVYEEVEDLDEAIDTMSDARIKYHATKGFPHGRYTSKEIKAEHERRRKSVPNYHAVKASLGEEVEDLDEAENKQWIEVTDKLGLRKRVPVHPTRAYAALNHYRKQPSTKSAKIVSEEVELDEINNPTVKSAPRGYGSSSKKPVSNTGTWTSKNKDRGGSYEQPKIYASAMKKEEVEEIDESNGKIAQHLIHRYGEKVTKSHVRSACNDLGGDPAKVAKMVRKNLNVLTLREKVETAAKTLEEGTMKLSKVHIVHHHDHPAAKEFAKHYTAAMKGDHREGGPTEADEKAANNFYERYHGVRTREGFAGSGTHVYTDRKTGAKWKVDRHPNGKTFYGTDHIISHHTGDIHEDVNQDYYFTEDEDRVIRSLAGAAEELGEELDLETLASIAEEVLSELSKKTLGSYGSKALRAGLNAKDDAVAAKRFKGANLASAKMYPSQYEKSPLKAKVVAKEETEQLDELSPKTLGSYINRASTQAFGKGYTGGSMITRGDYIRDKEEEKAGEKTLNKGIKRLSGINKAVSRLTKEDIINNVVAKEEVESLEELSKKTLGSYVSKAAKSATSNIAGAVASGVSGTPSEHGREMGRKSAKRLKGIDAAVKKLTKEDIINRAIEKYVPEDYTPPSLEEQMMEKVLALPESVAVTIVELFNSLNEENQITMLETLDSEDGVNALLNFVIETRGSE